MTVTALRCHTCGGQLQATSKIYWSLTDDGWVPVDFSDEELDLYCANDCDGVGLTDDEDNAARRPLADLVFDMGQRESADARGHEILSGRAVPTQEEIGRRMDEKLDESGLLQTDEEE